MPDVSETPEHEESRGSLAIVGGLWRHPDFLKLWAGQTVSLGGSLVSRVALPFSATLIAFFAVQVSVVGDSSV